MCADERRHGCASSYPDSFRVWWTDSCSLTDKLFSCEGCHASHTALPQILNNLSGSPDACAAVGLLYSLHFFLAMYIHWTKSTQKKMQTPTNLPPVPTVVPFLKSHVHGAITAETWVSGFFHSTRCFAIHLCPRANGWFVSSFTLPSRGPLCGCTTVCLRSEFYTHLPKPYLAGFWKMVRHN